MIKLIRYADTNSVEVTWTDVNGVPTKCQSYSDAQMATLTADLGADASSYTALIADVVSKMLPLETAANLAAAKLNKNAQINAWRAQANQTSFAHLGKTVACDALSRSDIDAVAGSISLNGAYPAGFPGAWKATDNTYLYLPDLASFKAMYSSMTVQGTTNFGKSQTLKTTLGAATTLAQVNAIVWG